LIVHYIINFVNLLYFRYSNVWKNCLTLYTGKIGEITKIGEYAFLLYLFIFKSTFMLMPDWPQTSFFSSSTSAI